MCEKVRQIKSPQWCNIDSRHNHTQEAQCNLSIAVMRALDSAIKDIKGLHLGDFERRVKDMESVQQWAGHGS